MMEGSENAKSKQFIEKLYIMNAKDYDATLNMFLTGDIPEEEKTELTIIETQPKKEEKMIDTVEK